MAQSPDTKLTVDNPEYWETLYKMKKTPWELGRFSPPLKTYLDSPYRVPNGRIAVLGCGTGNDALLFARYGFKVVAIDFAPSAIRVTREQFKDNGFLGTRGFILERDIFALHDYEGTFDYVLENTCFCSLEPSRRNLYAYTVRDLLKPKGKFIALWWTFQRSEAGGPPFATNESEIFDIFSPFFKFDIVHVPKDSVPERSNKELLTVLSKK